MNDKKIAFIICVNNIQYYEECTQYIRRLAMPEGFESDVIAITDALSMCEAYNAAMQSSDAKYKVYLHQDVFIIHKDFVKDLIEVFRSDEKIGMIGMIGGVNLPQDAMIWNAWNRGCVYACDRDHAFQTIKNTDDPYVPVEAVDGMLIATQHDIPWREDLALEWDFYDISQSLEFRRNDYRIAIPRQDKPWCIHDCGHSKLKQYDKIRKTILAEYKDFFSADYVPFWKDDAAVLLEEQLFQQILSFWEEGNFKAAAKLKELYGTRQIRDNNLQYAFNMIEIMDKGTEDDTALCFKKIPAWDQKIQQYNNIAFLLREIEQNVNTPESDHLLQSVRDGRIAGETVKIIARHSLINIDSVCEKF